MWVLGWREHQTVSYLQQEKDNRAIMPAYGNNSSLFEVKPLQFIF